MLNGIDPIIIFNFYKKIPNLTMVPIVASSASKVTLLPPIPIYLSEKLTGLYIDSESKNIDVQTSTETMADGKTPIINQKGLSSSVKVNLKASQDSIGLTLFGAMSDQIFQKVTSQEYSIDYLHGAVTVFNGLLNSFSIDQNTDNDLYLISFELVASNVKPDKTNVPVLSKISGAIPL